MAKVTEVTLHFLDKAATDTGVKAFADIILDDEWAVRGIAIIEYMSEGARAVKIQMPSKKLRDGSIKDVAHPISRPAYEAVRAAIVGDYEEELKKEA